MEKIVSLRDGIVPQGVPDPEIVLMLEEILEDAKDGHLRAIAIVAMKEVDMMRIWYLVHPPFSNAIIGATERLRDRLIRAVED